MLAFARTMKRSEAVGRFRNSTSRFYLLSGALDEISATDAERGSAASHLAGNIAKQARFEVILASVSIFLMVALSLIFFEIKVWGVLGRLAAMMKRLATNDFEVEIKGVSRRDEIGEMARAVQVFKDNGIEMRRLEAETELQRKAAEEARLANDKVLAELDEQRKFAVSAIARGLDELSRGNMAFRIMDAFSPEFQKLKEDFNTMTERAAALIGHVQKSGIRVSTSVTAIAANSKQQEATASEIAATTTQVSATSKEISATAKELASTMNNVSMVMEQTSTLASSGQAGLSRMEDTMRHVMEAASSINSKLAVLNEKAGNINQVVTTITKVADQTNLLSLNAAIEAEKAGEYGRGFAVVATEIRRLADQTGVATYDIEEMIKEIQSAISAGVMGMDKFSDEVRSGMEQISQVGEQLSQIIHQVQALAPRFEAVDEGMKAQATGAEQICEALLQLTESAQQTVESLRQSTLAIDELNQVSGGFHKTVSNFKVA